MFEIFAKIQIPLHFKNEDFGNYPDSVTNDFVKSINAS